MSGRSAQLASGAGANSSSQPSGLRPRTPSCTPRAACATPVGPRTVSRQSPVGAPRQALARQA
eukprot:3847333-Alexandrium_andersonii.AAC.1